MANLRAEISRKGLTARGISRDLGISEKAMFNKLSENTDFKRSEMYFIHSSFFPEIDIKYLFESNKGTYSKST
ncbi:MAG: hypothetical protein LBR74_02745 [Eubacterium sp.]|nr:hypothetical protein [Eubacterium sp.]